MTPAWAEDAEQSDGQSVFRSLDREGGGGFKAIRQHGCIAAASLKDENGGQGMWQS